MLQPSAGGYDLLGAKTNINRDMHFSVNLKQEIEKMNSPHYGSFFLKNNK